MAKFSVKILSAVPLSLMSVVLKIRDPPRLKRRRTSQKLVIATTSVRTMRLKMTYLLRQDRTHVVIGAFRALESRVIALAFASLLMGVAVRRRWTYTALPFPR